MPNKDAFTERERSIEEAYFKKKDQELLDQLHQQKALEAELIRFFPDEIIMPDEKHIKPFHAMFNKLGYCCPGSREFDRQDLLRSCQ